MIEEFQDYLVRHGYDEELASNIHDAAYRNDAEGIREFMAESEEAVKHYLAWQYAAGELPEGYKMIVQVNNLEEFCIELKASRQIADKIVRLRKDSTPLREKSPVNIIAAQMTALIFEPESGACVLEAVENLGPDVPGEIAASHAFEALKMKLAGFCEENGLSLRNGTINPAS